MRRSVLFSVGVAVLLASCSDHTPFTPDSADGPQSVLLDGSNPYGNPHFFFLAPLVNTSGAIGDFNAALSPTVVVCDPVGDGCGTERARWTSVSGTGSERVRVDAGDEHYIVNWHPGAFPAVAGTTYRLQVLLGEAPLGYLDVVFTTSQKDAKQAEAGGLVALRSGRTVPVKFRIEQGALAAALGTVCEEDCTEAAVTPGVETAVTTPSEQGGVLFTEEALTEEGPEPINFTVTIVSPGVDGCLPTDLQQYAECFRVTVDRDIALAPNTVVVGVCLDPVVLAQDRHNVTIYKVSEDEAGEPLGPVKPLQEKAAPFLDCDGFTAFGGSRHPLARLARAGMRMMRPVTSLVMPARLHAYDGGIGCDPVFESNLEGGFDSAPFSRFGWVRPVTVDAVAGGGQVAAAGATLPVAPQVRVWEAHGPDVGAPGVPVLFSFAYEGTPTQATTVLTDGDGFAWLPWTLGPDLGDYTVTITAPGTNIAGTPVPTVVFSATADLTLTALGKVVHRWPAEGGFADVAGDADGVATTGVGFQGGQVGQAFSFDGADSYIAVGTEAALSGPVNFSIEAWVRTSVSSGQVIINQRSAPFSGNSGFMGEYMLNLGAAHDGTPYPGKVYFMVFNGDFQWELVSSAAVDDGQWHHVVAVRHGSNGYIYVDGVLSASGSGGVRHLDGALPVYIGADVRDIGTPNSKPFSGLIDQLGIYGEPLNAAEVVALCQAGGGCQ